MPDVDLRQLERAAAQGDLQAGARLLRERVRRGLISSARVALAAWLGDPAALIVRPDADPCPEVDATEYLDHFASWGRGVAIRAACAVARWLAPPPEEPAGYVRLINQHDGAAVRLDAGTTLRLGRGDDVDVPVLNDMSISRAHCALSLDAEGQVWVRDLGSKNGTWLGSILVGAEPVEAWDGNVIRLGSAAFEVRGGVSSSQGWLEETLELLAAPGPEAYLRVRRSLRTYQSEVALVPHERAALGAAVTALCDEPAPGRACELEPRPETDSAMRDALRRALLAAALGPDPLDIPDPPEAHRIDQVSELSEREPMFREATEALRSLGLRALRPALPRQPILARAPDGALEWVTPLWDLEPDDWPRIQECARERLEHPGLVPFLGLAPVDSPRLAGLSRAGFVRGWTLPQWLQRRAHAAPPPARAVGMFRGLCGAAQLLSERLPRVELSEESVRVSLTGATYLERVVEDWIDYETHVHRSVWQHVEPDLAQMRHASPELALGSKGVDPRRSAVYQLGSLLFLTLTGRPPFTAASARVLLAILDEDPPVPSTLQRGISPELDAVVLKALAKAPDDRYPDPLSLEAALAATPEGSASP